MSTISETLNLMQLHAVRKMIAGQLGPVDCIVIPIEKNKLFVGEKGIYLNMICFGFTPKEVGDKRTHIVKQSFSKEIREAMTEEELKKLPILGDLTEWSGQSEQTVTSSNEIQDEISDLPF